MLRITEMLIAVAAVAFLTVALSPAFAGEPGVYEGSGGSGESCTGSADVTIEVLTSMRVKLSTYALTLPFNGVQEDLLLTYYGTLGLNETATVDAQYQIVEPFEHTPESAVWWFKLDWTGDPPPGHVHWELTNEAQTTTTFPIGTYAQGDPAVNKPLKVYAMPGTGDFVAGDTSTGVLMFTMSVD